MLRNVIVFLFIRFLLLRAHCFQPFLNFLFRVLNIITDGDNSINSFWVKAFLGALSGCGKDRNLLQLLTILETMTNNNRVASNVDFFCKPYCTFWPEPTWPELAWPPFSLRKLFKTVPFTSTSTVCNSSKHKVDQSSTFFRGVLIPLTSHSKNSPHHGALSVIKFMKFFG